jgi:DNA repair protein RecN (Recombination protein N)
MLTTLRIKNIALVDDLTLTLEPGFNVITGETGAGKSIILGALNLVLGERADRKLLRSGSQSCVVEAVFDLSKLSLGEFLEENALEPCENDQLILKRVFSASGVNRQFINGSPTTLTVLSKLGQGLVDIHGPHDHQSLLHPTQQLLILDAFGGLSDVRREFSEQLRRYLELEKAKQELFLDEQSYAQQLDLLRFQVQEIESANLQVGEQEQIEKDLKRIGNAVRLSEISRNAFDVLSESDDALISRAGLVGSLLSELCQIDEEAKELLELHEQGMETLAELVAGLSNYIDGIECDPQQLHEVEERFNLIQALQRKYGATTQEVLEFGEKAAQKLQILEQKDEEISKLDAKIENLGQALGEAGKSLSEQRRKVIPELCRTVSRELLDLGFKQSNFDVELRTSLPMSDAKANFSSTGLDQLEFQFAPNKGEPMRPLRAIASSGEMARVMLALKTVLAAQDKIPVLVFDEVDANVGGETARAVGSKMKRLGRQRQVFCVTHLAPVAANSSSHFRVSKHSRDGRTVSDIKLLGSKERIDELARMLGGKSKAVLKHAQELLESSYSDAKIPS